MTLFKLTKKQIIIRLILLAVLLLAGVIWLYFRACPNWCDHMPVPSALETLGEGTQESLIPPPEGFARIPAADGSFLQYMRDFPAWRSTCVLTYDGTPLPASNAAAVYQLTLPESGYQQCADTIMRLWGNYYLSTEQYDRIAFSYSNGYETKLTEWLDGWRYVTVPVIDLTFRMKLAGESIPSSQYNNYMQSVMRYAGTLSLEAESHTIKPAEAHAGDILCKGGAPGHAVVIVDEAENEKGERCFLIAQGFIPSQSAHIIAGVHGSPLGENCPWYTEGQLSANPIHLCSYTFQPDALRRWKEGFPNDAATEKGE